MSKDFQQSPVSRSITSLRYLQKAAKAIEARVEEEGDVPPWVQMKIRESAMNLGMAISYIQQRRGRKKERSK